MKRFFFVIAAMAILPTLSAQADMVVSASRSVYDSDLDILEFRVAGLTGLDAGCTVNKLVGEWTAGEGATIYMGSDSAFWALFTDSDLGPAFAPNTYVNFNELASVGDSQYWARTGSGFNYDSFKGSWYASGASGYWSDGSLVAKVFVTTGGDASFSGKYTSTYYGGTEFGTTFSSAVPEPGTLALAAIGLIGLICFAWRKRKSRS